jgi:20S proteasome alpha/beta subunit
MTCVVAHKTETGVLMAADSLTVGSGTIYPRSSPKLFAPNDRIVVGTSGWVRFGNKIRSCMTWPCLDDDPSPDLVETRIADGLRALLKDEPADAPFWALIAVDRDIYFGGPNGSAVRVATDYSAIGSGADVALGALFVLQGLSYPGARDRLKMALDAACEHIEGVRGPYVFAETVAP